MECEVVGSNASPLTKGSTPVVINDSNIYLTLTLTRILITTPKVLGAVGRLLGFGDALNFLMSDKQANFEIVVDKLLKLPPTPSGQDLDTQSGGASSSNWAVARRQTQAKQEVARRSAANRAAMKAKVKVLRNGLKFYFLPIFLDTLKDWVEGICKTVLTGCLLSDVQMTQLTAEDMARSHLGTTPSPTAGSGAGLTRSRRSPRGRRTGGRREEEVSGAEEDTSLNPNLFVTPTRTLTRTPGPLPMASNPYCNSHM